MATRPIGGVRIFLNEAVHNIRSRQKTARILLSSSSPGPGGMELRQGQFRTALLARAPFLWRGNIFMA